ncbi:MAG: hypothetical protein BZY88_00635 [SAR202 cluster bacterium Io17-Chloro-G9]|nr:MAG: hypothetical protein BZY88_00635 [SAR202 cluster bacterium Io17-Chloro-G9]
MDMPKIMALKDAPQRIKATARILEVGFGDGQFLRSLSKAGYSVTGTEVSQWMLDEVRDDLPDARLVLTDDPSGLDERFDAVCCFEVLEHIQDPLALARSFPGDLLYASVPDPWRWYPKLTGRYEYWDYPPNHLWRFCVCDAAEAGYHDPKCKQGLEARLAPGQGSMSLQWVLREAGYTQISIQQTPVQAHDLLRVIPIKQNSASYDEMRPRGRLGFITSTARKMLTPVTYPASSVLTLLGYHGVSYYVTAVRA